MGWRAPSKRCDSMQGGQAKDLAASDEKRGLIGGANDRSMTYRITGLDPAPFAALSALDDQQLASRGIVRMTADARPGFPCRVTLDDAEPGETLLLLNHLSHGGHNPYRATHAIFISESASKAAMFVDVVPPALERRILSLRAFDGAGMMSDAVLANPGEADGAIRALLADPVVDHIDVHNATRGCFAARIERS